MINYQTLLYTWKERQIKSSNKRPYIHFDRSINFKKRRKKISKELTNNTHITQHTFYPFIEFNIPKIKFIINRQWKKNKGYRKKSEKKRKILYSAHYDKLILSWYAFKLQQHYEDYINQQKLSESIIAYRKFINPNTGSGKSNIDFACDIFNKIKQQGECVAITFDIEGFFDNLSRDILKKNWKIVTNQATLPKDEYHIYKHITQYKFINQDDIKNTIKKTHITPNTGYLKGKKRHKQINDLFYKRGLVKSNPNQKSKKGIPQGSAISAVLSNIYMIEFDKIIAQGCLNKSAIYRRYSDDIIVICKIHDKQHLMDLVHKTAQKTTLLNLQKEKEDVTIFRYIKNKLVGLSEYNIANNDGILKKQYKKMQYLGFLFDGSEMEIRPSTISRLHNKFMRDYNKGKTKSQSAKSSKNIIFKRGILHQYTKYKKTKNIKYKRRNIQYVINCTNKTGSLRIKKQLLNFQKKVVKKINAFNKRYTKHK